MGFSPNEAKIYISLVKFGVCTVKKLEASSGVTREEIYRKIHKLEKQGYVERIFTKPAMFRPVPPKCIIKDILGRKAENLSKLQVETENLLHILEKTDKNQKSHLEDHDIIFIAEKRALFERGKESLIRSKSSVDMICSWKKGVSWLSHFENQITDALNRKVKIRIIIEKNGHEEFPRFIKDHPKNVLFQTRTIQVLPPASITIYDRKKLFISTSQTSRFVETPALWSNNPNIVGMAQIYFETIWKNSESIIPQSFFH